MIEWYLNPALRRRCQAGLNKGEAAHKLKRAVFFHERGEIRDRSFESQAFRAVEAHLAAELGTYQPYRHLHVGCGTSDAQRISTAPPSSWAAVGRISSHSVRP